jgi:hypothetical protein
MFSVEKVGIVAGGGAPGASLALAPKLLALKVDAIIASVAIEILTFIIFPYI